MSGPYQPAAEPTLHFIGVSTTQSSIMTVFPRWAEALELGVAAIHGIDLPLHAPPAQYRDAVEFIRNDPRSMGALVTAHKIDLLHACHDLFDQLDAHAQSLDEVSCLSKRNGRLVGHAKDPISARLALDAILPQGHWAAQDSDCFAIGAGGATTAITWNLMRIAAGESGPKRIIVSDIDAGRLDSLRRFHGTLGSAVPVDYVLAQDHAANDRILAGLRPGSLVINATGLGKDRPGSPLGNSARFPRNGIVWELNYRGALVFLDQADAQRAEAGLAITDGWNYFLHGWTQVIAEVFDRTIPPSGPLFERLSQLAGGPPRGRTTHAAG
jgi:shikimate 5-dehydrogenase